MFWVGVFTCSCFGFKEEVRGLGEKNIHKPDLTTRLGTNRRRGQRRGARRANQSCGLLLSQRGVKMQLEASSRGSKSAEDEEGS